jgi:hypothetical protein
MEPQLWNQVWLMNGTYIWTVYTLLSRKVGCDHLVFET